MAAPRLSTLANGLRVLVLPRPGTGAVAVAVHYGVGYRSEPLDRAGFAHLFEHLMFQGSAGVAKLEHVRRVQAAGGACNAVTARDHTCYYDVVPSGALGEVLFLESDRMRAPLFRAADIATQLRVIREEIGANVLGRPYGGLPWLLLPPVLFRSHANTHNGYGALDELASATVEECESFFERCYRPDNAVVTLVGDVDTTDAMERVEDAFGDIRPGATSLSSDIEEPLDREQRGHHVDRLAHATATAYGWSLSG
ncbi:MAG TPA: pitrilysin family protein, partial [Micromonosporaceae bacterium]